MDRAVSGPGEPADAAIGEATLLDLLPPDDLLAGYPLRYEEMVDLKDIGWFKVRAIRPSDAALFEALFAGLSPRSVYMRFFSPLKKLSEAMLIRFTRVDYDRQIALTAIQVQGEDLKMLAVSRVIATPGEQYDAEFAVLVDDRLQGRGLGSALLLRCMGIARLRGIRTICGIVLAENRQMLALGRKLHFNINRVPQSAEHELVITL
jgi:acetyltransferase